MLIVLKHLLEIFIINKEEEILLVRMLKKGIGLNVHIALNYYHFSLELINIIYFYVKLILIS